MIDFPTIHLSCGDEIYIDDSSQPHKKAVRLRPIENRTELKAYVERDQLIQTLGKNHQCMIYILRDLLAPNTYFITKTAEAKNVMVNNATFENIRQIRWSEKDLKSDKEDTIGRCMRGGILDIIFDDIEYLEGLPSINEYKKSL